MYKHGAEHDVLPDIIAPCVLISKHNVHHRMLTNQLAQFLTLVRYLSCMAFREMEMISNELSNLHLCNDTLKSTLRFGSL